MKSSDKQPVIRINKKERISEGFEGSTCAGFVIDRLSDPIAQLDLDEYHETTFVRGKKSQIKSSTIPH